MDERIALFTFSFGHHGRFSSYHHLKDFLPEARTFDATIRCVEWLPVRVRAAIAKRWMEVQEFRLRRFLRTSDRRVVHYFYPENSSFRAVGRKNQHALILTCHQPADFLRELPPRHPLLGALRKADAIILLSERGVEEYQRWAPQASVMVIPHGVDTSFWAPTETKGDIPVIITVGNWLRDYEGWAGVVRAMQGVMPQAEFVVVANRQSQLVARRYLQGSPAKVTFYSGLSDHSLRELYRRASIAFVPLHAAEANNAVLEGLAMQIPLVVTDLPAVRYYSGDAAIYVDQRNAAATAQRLVALASDDSERRALGQRGRRRAEMTLSWPKVAGQLRELYADVLLRPPKP